MRAIKAPADKLKIVQQKLSLLLQDCLDEINEAKQMGYSIPRSETEASQRIAKCTLMALWETGYRIRHNIAHRNYIRAGEVFDECETPVQTQFLICIPYMGVHCVDANLQLEGGLFHLEPICEELTDLRLARRKRNLREMVAMLAVLPVSLGTLWKGVDVRDGCWLHIVHRTIVSSISVSY
jgi:hypothetical protein